MCSVFRRHAVLIDAVGELATLSTGPCGETEPQRPVACRKERPMPRHFGLADFVRAVLPGISVVLGVILVVGCHAHSTSETGANHDVPKRDIHAVLRAHDQELLALPGVVGIFEGRLDDGETPCLKVMVARKTQELDQQIPKSLEGYPVVVEETGPIRPLQIP